MPTKGSESHSELIEILIALKKEDLARYIANKIDLYVPGGSIKYA